MHRLHRNVLYLLTKYEERVNDITHITVYKQTCLEHVIDFKMVDFLKEVGLLLHEYNIRPKIVVKDKGGVAESLLFSMHIQEEKNELVVSYHVAKNGQFIYSELQKIPGISD